MANKRKQFEAEDYEPVDVDKWETSQVKNALDDTIKKFVKQEFGYEESFSLFDQKLVLCTVACVLSLFALGYDYFYPFPESKYVLASCSISYFILMGILNLFTSYWEKRIFMVAREKDKAGLNPDHVWYFASSLPRFSDQYTVIIEYYNPETKKYTSLERIESISTWFDQDNALVFETFFRFFEELCTETKTKKTQ